MTDTPATSNDNEPSDTDIAAERQRFHGRLALARESEGIYRLDPVVGVLVEAVDRLYELLEHETRRIDNELTKTVTDRGTP